MRQRSGVGDAGQVLPLVALVVVVVGVVVIGLVRLTVAAVGRGSASTAADAAALAAAAEGEPAGAAVAKANGAVVERTTELGPGDVRVEVRRTGMAASARARNEPATSMAGLKPTSDRPALGAGRLAPALVAALRRAEQLVGHPIRVVSGYRSSTAQLTLWRGRAFNPFPVAPPGTSMHERGLAVDVGAADADAVARFGPEETGLCRPYPRTDPVHFELCTSRAAGFSPERGG